ncbi:hypothetical protein EBR43_01375 [bacterium]|nr:hypothetical protein [bacterium]
MQGICLQAYPTSAQKNILLSAKGVLVPPKLQVDTGRGERSKTSFWVNLKAQCSMRRQKRTLSEMDMMICEKILMVTFSRH